MWHVLFVGVKLSPWKAEPKPRFLLNTSDYPVFAIGVVAWIMMIKIMRFGLIVMAL